MKYYAIINEEQIGPMELPELVEAGLMPDTYVWCKGMADWQQANEVADICRFFRNRIFDIMHPTATTEDGGGVAERAEVMPMADEDYKGLKRREFYNAVGQQIQQTATDPDEEKMSQGEPPAALPGIVVILAILLFFPLGIAAYLMSRKARNQWGMGMAPECYQTARTAKMCAGSAISIGVIVLAVLIKWLMR